ncbi:MAG TPA: DUF2079 domain-containing protein [Polyangiaceae bacterium]
MLGLVALESTSAGLAGWELASRGQIVRHAVDDSLAWVDRRYVVADMGVGLAVGLAAVTCVLAIWRRGGLDLVERLAARASPLALAALVPLLFDARLWPGHDVAFLALALVFGGGAFLAARTALETPPAFPRVHAWTSRVLGRALAGPRAFADRVDAPLLVTVAGALAYATYFACVTVIAHRNLGTNSFDLGLEDNLMWNLVHGGPLFRATPFDGPTGTHLRNHATFLSFGLAPFYALAQGPETLLVVQALMMGAAAVPLQLWARRLVPAWTATVVSLLYLLYAPLHGANLYDFHYLPLGVVFLWTVLYAVEAKRPVLAVAAVLLALATREDVACCLAVLGAFFLLTGRAPRAGAAIAVGAGAYFLVMKLGVMPLFKSGAESFVHQYEGLLPPQANGFGGILQTVVADPAFTANIVVEPAKVLYVLQLLVPMLFLPLTRRIGLLLVAPGFLFTLLATHYPPLTEISFQYSSYWTMFLFPGLVLVLSDAGRASPVRRRALTCGVAAASLACSYFYGAVFQHTTMRHGFDAFHWGTTPEDVEHRAALAAVVAEIPRSARVTASEHLVPHVSDRPFAYTLRFGVYDADYLLFASPPWGDECDVIKQALKDGTFGFVDSRGPIYLAQRGAPTTRNSVPLARCR